MVEYPGQVEQQETLPVGQPSTRQHRQPPDTPALENTVAKSTKNTGAPTLRTNDAPAVNDAFQLVGHTITIDPREVGDTQNVRAHDHTDEDVQDLRKSLKRGQWQNILVKPVLHRQDGQPRFEIVDGRRRLRAALLEVNGNKDLGVNANDKFRIRAYVQAPDTDNKGKNNALDTYTTAYRANMEAEGMTPLDQAHVYNTLRVDHKLNDLEARKIMGVSQGWTNVLAKLMDITPEVKAALQEGKIDANTAADTIGLDSDAIERVLAAMENAGKAKRKLFEAAKIDPSIEEEARAKKEADKAAKRAARETAAEERRKANDAKKAAGVKLKGNANRSGKGAMRTGQEVRAVFADLVGDTRLPAGVKRFAMDMVSFVNQKMTPVDLVGSILEYGNVDAKVIQTITEAMTAKPGVTGAVAKPKVKVKVSA